MPTITYSISHQDVRRVANLRAMLIDANSDDRHAAQRPGHLYGDLATALKNLLLRLTDNAVAAAEVYEHLLDTYGDTTETMNAIYRGLALRAAAKDYDLRVVWTGQEPGPGIDHARYGAHNPNPVLI